MLTDQQFNEYVAAHNLSSAALEYIQDARSSEASRMVGVAEATVAFPNSIDSN